MRCSRDDHRRSLVSLMLSSYFTTLDIGLSDLSNFQLELLITAIHCLLRKITTAPRRMLLAYARTFRHDTFELKKVKWIFHSRASQEVSSALTSWRLSVRIVPYKAEFCLRNTRGCERYAGAHRLGYLAKTWLSYITPGVDCSFPAMLWED